jgi:ankyrin repeat protein
MILARMPKSDILKLLIDKGANVNAKRSTGQTALIYAAYNGRKENVKLLLAVGADPNATATEADFPGSPRYDAVLVAERQHHPEVAALVRDAQAKKRPTQSNP